MIDMQEKAVLKNTFPNYNPIYHDAFKIAYIKWAEAHKLWAWHKDRGTQLNKPEPQPRDFIIEVP